MSPAGRKPTNLGRTTGPREFGRSWWGRAWIEALQHRAQLDPNRLPRGRSYARHNRVDDLRIEDGHIHARVFGNRATPYSTMVRVRPFTDDEWDRALGAIAARAAHLAALVDGELSPEVAEDVRSVGLDLLPGPGDLGFSCTCPDWASPCKHAAAVCFLAANRLDLDPFALLVLRGRSRDEVLASIRRVRAGGDGPHGGTPPPLVPARSLAERPRAPLPAWPSPPEHPGPPVPLADDPPAGSPVDTTALEALAGDAARRAWAVLARSEPTGLGLDGRADLARRAATAIAEEGESLSRLARRSGNRIDRLAQLGGAWALGGEVGVVVVDDPVEADPEVLEAARLAILDLGPRARARVRGDGVYTGTGVLLRPGPDRRWYRLERRGRTWDLAAPPADDPADLVTPADVPPPRPDRLTPPPRLPR